MSSKCFNITSSISAGAGAGAAAAAADLDLIPSLTSRKSWYSCSRLEHSDAASQYSLIRSTIGRNRITMSRGACVVDFKVINGSSSKAQTEAGVERHHSADDSFILSNNTTESLSRHYDSCNIEIQKMLENIGGVRLGE